MKKIIFLGLMTLFLLTGCGKLTAEKAVKEFKENVEARKAYEIKGTMEIINDEDLFKYKVVVAFKKDDYYKVSLVNQTNNHEQLILKNSDGVFVVTPSLNKSFKFQSDWPKNSSQAYLLQSLVDDLEKTEKIEMETTDDGYVLKAKVSYPNNVDLTYEKLYFDKDMNIKRVEVYNDSNSLRIKMEFESINYKATLADDDFLLESVIDENCCKQEVPKDDKKGTSDPNEPNDGEDGPDETTSKLDDILYPLYVPAGTYLTGKDIVQTSNGERVILTFAGEKNFILVEETLNIPSELEVVPVYGDPLMLNDTIAALSGNSLHWSSSKVNYYLSGDNLTGFELLTIATSLANTDATPTAITK